MQAKLIIKCAQCEAKLSEMDCDTADMPDELQSKVNRAILAHRSKCWYYRDETKSLKGGTSAGDKV